MFLGIHSFHPGNPVRWCLWYSLIILFLLTDSVAMFSLLFPILIGSFIFVYLAKSFLILLIFLKNQLIIDFLYYFSIFDLIYLCLNPHLFFPTIFLFLIKLSDLKMSYFLFLLARGLVCSPFASCFPRNVSSYLAEIVLLLNVHLCI